MRASAIGRRFLLRLLLALLQITYQFQPISAYSAEQPAVGSPRALEDVHEYYFDLSLSAENITASTLEYEVLGATSAASVRRSLNGAPPLGGQVRITEIGRYTVRDALPPSELRQGRNRLYFLKNDHGQNPMIINARLTVWSTEKAAGASLLPTVFSVFPVKPDNTLLAPVHAGRPSSLLGLSTASPPLVDILFPQAGEHFGSRALVRGQARKGVTVYINGQAVRQHNGAFETIIEVGDVSGRKVIELQALDPSGQTETRKLALTSDQVASDLSLPEIRTASLNNARPTATLFGATLSLTNDASDILDVVVTCLRRVETPAAEIVENLRGSCTSFRVEKSSNAPVVARLPVYVEGAPKELDPGDTRVIAFNNATNAWSIVPDSFLDFGNKQSVATLRERASTITTGILPSPRPDAAEPVTHTKSGLSDLSAKLDPLGGMVTLAPPEPNPYGAANLTFPIMLRPVRGAIEPRFNLTYNSLRGNGLAGDGWTLEVPTISVETKWGVPAYSQQFETETYVYQGDELVAFDDADELPPSYRNNFSEEKITRDDYRFRLRRETLFAEFIRHGSKPSEYWWEIRYKDGNKEFYGSHDGQIAEPAVRRHHGNGAIFDWGLTRAEDKNGNFITYEWQSPADCTPSPCVTALIPSRVIYNQHRSIAANSLQQAGTTKVNFGWAERTDKVTNARTGRLVEQRHRLSSIAVAYDLDGREKRYADYTLSYSEPSPETMAKSLLDAVSINVPENDDCAGPCAEQTVTLEYHQPDKAFARRGGADSSLAQSIKVEGVGLLKNVTNSLLGSASALGTNVSDEKGGSLYVGVSPIPKKQLSGGGKVGYTARSTLGRSLIVDLTGDGLTDIVVDDGGIKVCPGNRDPASGIVGYPTTISDCKAAVFTGVTPPVLSEETSNSFSVGGEFHLAPKLIFGGAYSRSRSAQSTYFADVDGNGLIDIVSGGRAVFNQGADTNGVVEFRGSTSFVKQPGAALVSANAFAELKSFYDQARREADSDQAYFKAADLVSAWRAPNSGVVGISGPIAKIVDGPKDPEITRVIVERSSPGGGEAVRCAQGDVWPPSPGWAETGLCLLPLGANEAQQLSDLKSLLGADAPLFIAVAKNDVIYFRTSGSDSAQANPGFADIAINYAVRPRSPWEVSATVAGMSETTQFVLETVRANGNRWAVPALNACLKAGVVVSGPKPPKCDQYGKSPDSFALVSDIVFSAVSNNDLLLDTSNFVPPFNGVDAHFSGLLKYPVGTQPIQISLLSKVMPDPSNRTDITARTIERDLIDDAPSLSGGGWDRQFATTLPGACTAPAGLPEKLAPPVPGVHVSCDSAGQWIIARFEKVPLNLCGAACITTKRLRLELQPQFGVRLGQPYPEVITAYDKAGQALAYGDFFWEEAPRIAYQTRGKVPLDAAELPSDSDGVERVAVNAPSQQVMASDTTQIALIAPLVRGRYRQTVDADRIGRKNGSPYQYVEIVEERDHLDVVAASGGQRFDDPEVAGDGYRLPAPLNPCTAPDGTCEYRIAHSFFSDDPKQIEDAPAAFAFDVTVFVDGKLQILKYLGTVPHFACGLYPTTGYPSEHLRRPVDCGLQDPSLIVPDSRAPEHNVGMQFILNDGNRVRGRDLIYAFRAKPGDTLNIAASVRPVWNAPLVAFKSNADLGDPNCANANFELPRDALWLLEQNTLAGGACRRWFGLRSSEFRLGVEGGLGLADSTKQRLDFARLFVPVHHYEEHQRLDPGHPKSPRIATDHRNWVRFASTYPEAARIPAYDRLQFEKPRAETPQTKIDRVSVECSGRTAGECRKEAEDVTSDSSKIGTYPLIAAYWTRDLSDVYADAKSGATTLSAHVDGFDYGSVRRADTCGVKAQQISECYLGPDADIWMALRRYPFRDVAYNTGRIGPDDLARVVPSGIAQTLPQTVQVAGAPPHVVPSLPIPGLFSQGETLSARVGVISSLWADGDSRTLYTDMNGDGYPDPLIGGTVFHTGPTGVPRDQWLPGQTPVGLGIADPRNSESRSVDLSIAIGDGGVTTAQTPHPVAGAGALGQTVGIDNVHGAWTDGAPATAAVRSSPDAPFGLALSLNASLGVAFTPDDVLDVNGDGLPDLVDFDEPSFLPTGPQKSGAIRIRLNLGYEFSAVVSLNLPQLPATMNAAGGLGPQLGYNDGNGGWSGGLALARTFSSSRQSLVDINGDGLTDLVSPKGNSYAVFLNRGGDFAQTALTMNMPEGWDFRDVSASESSTIDTGVTVAPAYPCGFFCFIIQNPGVRAGDTLGRQLVSAQDLNGDGLLDLASTGGFYQGYSGDLPKFGFDFGLATQNYLNPLGKQNKLRRITNPSGNVVSLDYELIGNEDANNPKGIWALNTIIVDDGFHAAQAGDGQDAFVRKVKYAGGKYDRWERAFLGYAHLRIEESGADCLPQLPCSGLEAAVPLRATVRQYLNETIYVQGLPAREETKGPRDQGFLYARDFVYDLWPISNQEEFTQFKAECADDPSADEACIAKTAADRSATSEKLLVGLWDNIIDRRHMPRLRLTRGTVSENSQPSRLVRSMLMYDYDVRGNVTSLLDFGQVGEAGQQDLDNSDDYRADLQYDADILDVHDRVETMLIQRGVSPGWLGDNVMRLREAVYDSRGNLTATCQYLQETAALARRTKRSFCDDAALEWEAAEKLVGVKSELEGGGANWAGYRALVGRIGLSPMDIVLERRLDFDPYGNPQRLVSPFNVNGERIETYRCFNDDPFAISATRVRQLRLRVDGRKLDRDAHCQLGATAESPLADFMWTSDVDPHLGTIQRSVDINRNSLGYGRDGWGRLRTVVSDWGAPNSDDPRIPENARAQCANLLPGRAEACSIMLYFDYEAVKNAKGLRSALARRYALEDLYAEGAGQDDKSALWNAVLVDGVGKLVQSNREAGVCLTRGRRPDPNNNTTYKTSGPPELCGNEASAIASGWRVYDGLGRLLEDHYPRPIVNPANTAAGDVAVSELNEPSTLAASPYAEYVYDAMSRAIQVRLPDDNSIKLKFSVAPEGDDALRLNLARTTLVDARCAVRQVERDARGLILQVAEAQAPPLWKEFTAGALATDERRAKEKRRCHEDVSLVDSSFVAKTIYEYDILGQIVRIKRPLDSDIISSEYDLIGRRTRIADPDRGDEIVSYDPLSNIIGRDRTSYRAVAPRKIRYLFAADRMTGIRYDASYANLNVDYVYDDFPKNWAPLAGNASTVKWLEGFSEEACRNCIGQLVAIKDSSGLSVRTFDVYGQVSDTRRSILYEGQEIGRFELRSDYDTWGTLRAEHIQDIAPERPSSSCINPRRKDDYICDYAHSIFYAYDQGGRPVGIRLDNRDIARFAYDEFDATFAKWVGDGSLTDLTYDAVDRRLNLIRTTLFDASPLISAGYQYDSGGNLLGYENAAGTYTADFAFEYDGANRLTSVDGNVMDAALGPDSTTLVEAYAYDLRHRLKQKGSKSYVYPAFTDSSAWKPVNAPEFIGQGDDRSAGASQAYNAWGELSSSTDTTFDVTHTRRLDWDPEARLASIQITNSHVVVTEGTSAASQGTTAFNDYVYDHLGARVVKREGRKGTVPGTVANEEGWKHLYVSPSFSRRYDGPGFVQIALGGVPIASVTFNNTAQKADRTTVYYHSELPNGSVTATTRQVLGGAHEGRLYQRATYAPFGEPIRSYRYGADESDIDLAPHFAFAGKERDLDTGYSYFGARYYDPRLALWISPDPALGSYLDGTNAGPFLSQNLSSYSYGMLSPVLRRDKDGRIVPLLIAAWAVAEIGLSAYDAYDTASTLLDPNASARDKWISGGGFVLGMIAPGGGYGSGGKIAVESLEQVADHAPRVFKAGEDVIHFERHAAEIAGQLGFEGYTVSKYVDDANWVIQHGQFAPEINAYVSVVGGKGSAKGLMVGVDRATGEITTMHLKSVSSFFEKKAPSLGWQAQPRSAVTDTIGPTPNLGWKIPYQ
ncbi:MAG: hypothetical protein EOS34_28075 [Mesorhizobium sp.]|nr:MAG: hypothetical protein EOS34_28075 [Mesorhizobium sp.]